MIINNFNKPECPVQRVMWADSFKDEWSGSDMWILINS